MCADNDEVLGTLQVADAAYQGQPGAYSEQAARKACGPKAKLLPCETLAATFAAVRTGQARCAVVPLENSLAGPVPGCIGLLLESGLIVHAEATERIDHVLAGPPGSTLGNVREVLSHPIALAQCERFLRSHPAIRPVPVFDTAGALQMVMHAGTVSRAAIAGRAAAALYGAAILAEHVQDHAENFTRFIQVAPPPGPPVGTGPCRLLFGVRLAHRPGTLAAALQALAGFDINLTRLDSSPVAGRPFEYEFVIEGRVMRSAGVAQAIRALESHGPVRLLGCFPAPGD